MSPRVIGADEARALLKGTTPGPWVSEYTCDDVWIYLISGRGYEVARIVDGQGSEEIHDKNLIEAAPDLAHTVIALTEIVDAVRMERAARVAWLASLPPGSCTSPPPDWLLAAEERTRGLLLALNGEAPASIPTRDDVRELALAELELTIKSLCDLAHAMAAKVSKVRS